MEFDKFLRDVVEGRVGVDLIDDDILRGFEDAEGEALLEEESALIGGANADGKEIADLSGKVV